MPMAATNCSESDTAMTSVSTLEVEHLTHYRYAAPVELAHHLGYLRPLDGPGQQLLDFAMDVSPAPMHMRHEDDWLGNRRSCFTVTTPHRELRVHVTSRVRITAAAAVDPQSTPPWEQVRQRLSYQAGAPFEPASEFVFASPFVPATLPALRAFAGPSFPPGRPLAQAAIDLMARIHTDFKYCSDATKIETPLTEVLSTREGVCQDFAHLMIGALRSLGLAARYVSGYLLTGPLKTPAQTGAETAPMVGADASHAWVAVWCPSVDGAPARWIELDPTNNMLPSVTHVRLGFGRDYGDVTPLRGVIRGGGEHQLAVHVKTNQLA